jgi:deoxyribose-phosphate aldolase
MDKSELARLVTQEVLARIKGVPVSGGGPTCSLADICSACGQCVVTREDAVRQFMSSGAARISASRGVGKVADDLALKIDHTLLKPEATEKQVENLCAEAIEYKFCSVCINPWFVPLCAKLLRRSGVKVCTVIGFPLGATTPETKAYETRDVIGEGAEVCDMFINVGALKSGDYGLVERDIRGVVRAARSNTVVKVILETCLLTDEEKMKACEIAKKAGADYVKTSTGFSTGGATAEDIALMRRTVGPEMGVKASGGVRSKEDAEKMVKAGATRIGASASVKIVSGKGGGAEKY